MVASAKTRQPRTMLRSCRGWVPTWVKASNGPSCRASRRCFTFAFLPAWLAVQGMHLQIVPRSLLASLESPPPGPITGSVGYVTHEIVALSGIALVVHAVSFATLHDRWKASTAFRVCIGSFLAGLVASVALLVLGKAVASTFLGDSSITAALAFIFLVFVPSWLSGVLIARKA